MATEQVDIHATNRTINDYMNTTVSLSERVAAVENLLNDERHKRANERRGISRFAKNLADLHDDVDELESAVFDEFNTMESRFLKLIIRLETRITELESR
jgi:septal ring factor EnvC (AmiA/AmiB activator)